ncbi:MAG TPA: glycosyltransferase [Pyrinomonadaceae bacterium]|jgi:glycosyltransferase involved in cell wall biosynthesis|nr:glycosyltransferase [Pyrinomonadaceae bacterium]
MIAVIVQAAHAPFHRARFRAARARGLEDNRELFSVAVSDVQGDYKWPQQDSSQEDLHSRVLFPGCDYWTLSYRRIRRALYSALDEISPDVVALPGWGFAETLAGLGWCIRRGRHRVVISDSQAIDSAQTQSKLLLKRLIVSRFQAAFAGGQPHVRYLEELGLAPERCFVGCDVVDNEFFDRESQRDRAQQQRQERERESALRLLSCVRLLPRKNILGVLDVMKDLDGWTWTIAGDGPQLEEIERQIKTLQLTERVRLVGHVDYDELPRVYSEADVYLQPSLVEPWGLVVNEAMACALPVLVSNACGCREDLVKEGVNGYTFDPSSPESLKQALQLMIDNRERLDAMGQASRRLISGWGLDLFAQNFWRACDAALLARAAGRRERVISRALGFPL